jgi:hypothetical protein
MIFMATTIMAMLLSMTPTVWPSDSEVVVDTTVADGAAAVEYAAAAMAVEAAAMAAEAGDMAAEAAANHPPDMTI